MWEMRSYSYQNSNIFLFIVFVMFFWFLLMWIVLCANSLHASMDRDLVTGAQSPHAILTCYDCVMNFGTSILIVDLKMIP